MTENADANQKATQSPPKNTYSIFIKIFSNII